MIHIYVGDGKGKTTAAIGLAIRNIGYDGKVLFAQFLKNMRTGEIGVLSKINGLLLKRPAMRHKGFIWNMNQTELDETKEDIEKGFIEICEIIDKGSFSLVVLDEVLDIIDCGFLNDADILSLLEHHPETEFILTGRKASKDLKKIADYITVMNKEKHPYDRGIKARKGIEY